jgi:gamma-glutamylcyclotransferase (GGCT)/AIG2-like uncharacterized protein YtfP
MRGHVNYFAYGSNLSHKQMHERCPDAVPIGPARLIGYRLIFAGYSERWRGAVADVRPNPEWYVQGGLYRMTGADWKSLDVYEGCPHFYLREEVQVLLPSAEFTTAMIYRMAEQLKPGKPSRSYLETIITGFFQFGITPPPEISAAEYIE